MPRPRTKEELMLASKENYEKLNHFISKEEATRLLEQSHKEVLELLEGFSNNQLFTKGVYKWTGGTSLGSYFVSATSSHYDWALKKLKAHQKNCKNS